MPGGRSHRDSAVPMHSTANSLWQDGHFDCCTAGSSTKYIGRVCAVLSHMYLCKPDSGSKLLFYQPPQDPVINMSGECLASDMWHYNKPK